MLEAGPALRSWRLLGDPRTGEPVPAAANADHRVAYLDTQGPVSGERGSVRRVDAGSYDGELGETWEVLWRGAAGAGVARMIQGEGGLVFVIIPASRGRESPE